jgi:type IV pilus assembly protein PilE
MKRSFSRRVAGFTLIEVMCVMGLIGILASIAYPTFQSAVLKARRLDAVSSLMQAHLSQERWRGGHLGYASAQELRLPERSAMGHYRLDVAEASADGFALVATAEGSQAADRDCRVLRLSVERGHLSQTSGTEASHVNTAQLNRRCWAL